MASYNIELNSNPNRGGEEYTLLLRITVNRKHARLKLDHAISEKHFNPKPKQNKYVRSSHKRHAVINNDIDDTIQKAKDAAKSLESDGKLVTAIAIKEKMTQVDYSSVFEFARELVTRMEKNGQVGSVKKYNTLIKRLKGFQKGKDLLFAEIDHSYLERLFDHFRSEGNSNTTASKYLETLRTVYNKAVVAGIANQSSNPFLNFKTKRDKVYKERLTLEEIQKIEELDLPKGSVIWHTRNAFLFSFYCAGIRASDVLQLTWGNVFEDRIVYQMQKTGKPHSIKLHAKSKGILDLYERGKLEDFVFPFLSNDMDYSDPTFKFNQLSSKTSQMNNNLVKIASLAEIDKKISTHIARHSFADIARKKTTNLYNLSKTMGHTKLATTQNYLSDLDQDGIDETMDGVFS